jgi:hypothetical protein
MGKQTPDTAIFLTRQDVANLLRMTPHNVDLLARKGKLEKTKLGPGRTGIHRDSVSQYLANLNASVSAGVSPAKLDQPGEFTLGAIPGHVGDAYGSTGMMVHVKADWDRLGEVAEALDGWLTRNGFPGCFVMAGNGAISVMWAKSIGYRHEPVRKAIDGVKASIVHAAE